MVFFNNQPTTQGTVCYRQKEKIRERFFLLLSRPNLQFCKNPILEKHMEFKKKILDNGLDGLA